MKRHPLLSFFIITFAITWGVGALFFLLSPLLIEHFGEVDMSKPVYRALFNLAVYGPAISAFIVIGRVHGAAGILAYCRRLLHWRVNIKYYLLVLLGIPILCCSSIAIYVAAGGNTPEFSFSPWFLVIPWALFGLIGDAGPMEELGWRGFALPLLQQKYNAFWASVILGAIWAIWHLPSHFIAAAAVPQGAATFMFRILDNIILAIIMTALYNKTGGSIPLAFLFHWQSNNMFRLSLLPHDNFIYSPAYAVVAIVIIIVLGPRNLGKEKYTDPVPLEAGGKINDRLPQDIMVQTRSNK